MPHRKFAINTVLFTGEINNIGINIVRIYTTEKVGYLLTTDLSKDKFK